MKEEIRTANGYVLKSVFINIIMAAILSFFEVNQGQIIIYTLMVIISLKMANKGYIELPFQKPDIKKLLLCIGITITAFPLAAAFNMLGSIINGNHVFGIEIVQPLWLLILDMAIFPAVGEEVMHRGLIQGAYMKISALYSILFSALAFALMHFSFSAMMYAFLYGCLFALVRIFTNNMLYSICMHVCFNLINIGCLYINMINMNNGDIRHIANRYIVNINISTHVMLAVTVVSSVLCGVMIMLLQKSSKVCFEKDTYSAKDFISRENVIAYVICFIISICML